MGRTITSATLLQRFDDQDRLVEETQLTGGTPHGISKLWTSTGVLIGQARYRDGKLDGEAFTWNVMGQLISKANYENGELHGQYQSWWDNGQEKESGLYVHDARAEPYVWYDHDGKVVQRK